MWLPVTCGVDEPLVGSIQRVDGPIQVTLAGWPLYTLAGDNGELTMTGGNGADGMWFAANPQGENQVPPMR